MKTPNLIKTSTISLSLVLSISLAHAGECSKDEANEMYSKVNNHAAALKADAEANPSSIPFKSGKNDPRLKKSIKIESDAKSIYDKNLEPGDYAGACDGLTEIAKEYDINLGDETEATASDNFKTGMKAAAQANSLRDSVKD